MPRYVYRCTECELTETVMHGISEVYETCGGCGQKGFLAKQLGFPSMPSNKGARVRRVGEKTEEFIESARRDLAHQIEELKREE